MNGAGPLLSTLAGLVYLLLIAPVVVVILIAFSADSFIIFPPSGFSLRWFERLLAVPNFVNAFGLSLRIATVVTALSLALGVPAAYAIVKGSFPGRAALQSFFLAPLLLPTLVAGLALLIAFQPLRLTGTQSGLILAHLTVTLPFVVRMMTTAFSTLPNDVEAAAATLGARPHRVFLRVSLPLAAPGLLACATLSFLLSFDETVISLFIAGPRAQTLPVEMVHYIEGRTDPLVAALSVVILTGTLLVVVAVERLVGVTRAMGR